MRVIEFNGRKYAFSFERRIYGRGKFFTWVNSVTDVETKRRYTHGILDPYPAVNPPDWYLRCAVEKFTE